MTTDNQLCIEVFEAIASRLRDLIAGTSDEHLAAFTAERTGKETAWIQQIAWDEIRRRRNEP